MAEQRIKLEDTELDIILKMSEGNLGAITVCTQIFNKAERIDPDAIMKGLSTMLSMDMYCIYGSRIWMLYKDVCKESIIHTVAILRACQLGFLSQN